MEAHFRREVERLTRPVYHAQSGEFSVETKELQSKLKDAENRKNKESKNPAAFSMEEALSPKDSIERTCQALGLAK